MDNKTRLDEAWSRVRVSKHYMRPDDFEAIDGTIANGMTHFTRHEKFWTMLLTQMPQVLDPEQNYSVLITAMSVGCEVYDAARIAKGLGLDNIHFYGHDISPKFTERAAEGVYPLEKSMIIPDLDQWFDVHKPAIDYVRIKADKFNNVSFLKPSDIRDLDGKFDIVVENIMNPCPKDISLLLLARARHLAIETYAVAGASKAFTSVAGALQDFTKSYEEYEALSGKVSRNNPPDLFIAPIFPDDDAPGYY